MPRANPHLIEINTILWIKQLRIKYSVPEMTLSSVPDEEWLDLRRKGFDIVWLVGVWQSSPESEQIAKKDKNVLDRAKALSPNFGPDVIGPSPYSIYLYYLNPELGFEWELKATREKLNSMGMKLMLDIVSNHTAKDAPYVHEHPECFIQGNEQDYKEHPDWFFESEKDGKKIYIAYGRDPNFPPWTDTAQLNYYNPDTHREMMEALMRIADAADAVRCDMVMLSLNDMHGNIWNKMLKQQGFTCPKNEFWTTAIQAVKEKYPSFIFLAEVYWGLEWRLQEMGFDYTYDKVTYDRLLYHGPSEVHGHLRAEKLYQKRSARFIDNHDEKPSLVLFGKQKALAAATVISTIKGLRLYTQNQIDGVNAQPPLQLTEPYPRTMDSEVKRFYSNLLSITNHPAFHGGEWNLLEVNRASKDDKTNTNIIAWKWAQHRTVKLVVVNYANTISSGVVMHSVKPTGTITSVVEEISGKTIGFKEIDLQGGVHVNNMSPYQAFIFTLDI